MEEFQFAIPPVGLPPVGHLGACRVPRKGGAPLLSLVECRAQGKREWGEKPLSCQMSRQMLETVVHAHATGWVSGFEKPGDPNQQGWGGSSLRASGPNQGQGQQVLTLQDSSGYHRRAESGGPRGSLVSPWGPNRKGGREKACWGDSCAGKSLVWSACSLGWWPSCPEWQEAFSWRDQMHLCRGKAYPIVSAQQQVQMRRGSSLVLAFIVEKQ